MEPKETITTAIQVPEALGHHMPYKRQLPPTPGEGPEPKVLLHGPHPLKGMETLAEV